MGKHFVPRKYLAGFSAVDRPTLVWQFDKELSSFRDKPVSINKVAQQRNFYSEETESQITKLVESPGNAVLDKLRSGNFSLTAEERMDLAVYIATMLTRVPKHRARGHAMLPTVLTDIREKLHLRTGSAERSGIFDAVLASRRSNDIDRVCDSFAQQMPQEIIDQIESPWPTAEMVQLVHDMYWRFVPTDGTEHFVTSDNPAFLFDCWGLKNRQSELVFPLSSHLGLFGSWTPVKRASRGVVTGTRFVKEANRRIAVGASRFVFCRSRVSWLSKVAHKKVEQLNRILW